MAIQFLDEIEKFERILAEKEIYLQELNKKRDSHSAQTQKTREALLDLEAVLAGEVPPSKKEKTKSTAGISSVPVNDDTNRPARGARRNQIIEICKHVGEGGKVFRTAAVLKVLRSVEDEFSTGMRSYTYTVMNHLEAEELVERKGRGKWLWKG